jgi:enoyl-CoA hydratase/carnithine racemase
MAYEQIKWELEDGILTITLNRPEKLNAYTDATMAPELIDAFDAADENDEVRAVIVTGAGRGFCAGHDLDEGFDYEEQEGATLETHRDYGGMVALRLYDMKKPVIAAINGAAVGVGITMTLPMDIRIASERAKFGFVFTRMGIVNEACSSWFLPRIVGMGKAMEWSLSGRIFDAREALSAGLVSYVTEHEKLYEKALEAAREIADHTSAVAVPVNRQLLWKMLEADHPMAAHRIESKCIFSLGRGPDAKEAAQAFNEKRRPAFTMKASTDMPDFYPWWKTRAF